MKGSIIILALLLGTNLLCGQSTPVYEISSHFEGTNEERERYNDLYSYTQVLEDPTGNWTYEDILLKTGAFGKNKTRSEDDLRKVYWVKLPLQAMESDSFLFSVGKLYEDHNLVDIYYTAQDSVVHQRSGYAIRAAEKSIRRSGSYFWIHLPENQVKTVYIRVDNLYRDCYCWEKSPVSVYHIDRASVKYRQAAYVLRDFESEEIVIKGKDPRTVDLIRYFEFYPDPDCELELEEVRRDWDQKSYFRGYKIRDLPMDTCHWVRLRVINPQPVPQTRTFAYKRNRWDRIEYYLPDQEGNYLQYEAFPNEDDQRAFTFTIGAMDTLELYIRYPKRTNVSVFNGSMLDIEEGDLREWQGRTEYKYLFVGMILFLLIYFFLQLVVNRDELLLYYFIALLGLTPFFLISLDRTAFFTYTRAVYLVPVIIGEHVISLAHLLATIGMLKFTQIALDLRREMPRHHEILNWAIVMALILCIGKIIAWTLAWTGQLKTTMYLFYSLRKISSIIGGLLAGFLVYTGIRAYSKKIPLSGNFLIALLPVSLAIFWNSFLVHLIFPDSEIYGPFVIGLLLTLLLFSVLIGARASRIQREKAESEKQKIVLQNQVLQIESKALRAQMNPHFIFNCLNSIKSLIQESNDKQAIHYLTQFSKFIRNVLQHSEEKRISLDEELEMSRLYLEMEKLRFEKSFNYRITVAADVETDFVKIPPMILQPFLENAIWHGLMHKNGDRMLHLEVYREGDTVKCIVEDNGIGRKQAAVLQAGTRSHHRSFGTRLILDRLQINKELFDSSFVIHIIDKMVNGKAAGTRVELSLFT